MADFSTGRKRFYNLNIPPEQRLEVEELLLRQQNAASLKSQLPLFPNLRVLVVESSEIEQFPTEICSLYSLEVLSLKNNHITSIPEQIRQLTQLKKLDLSGNRLQEWPESVLKMSHLQSIDLSDNALTEIPKDFRALRKLTELLLAENQITILPREIGHLQQLKQLNLTNNQLKRLPKALGKCQQLEVLKLSQNKLTALTDTLGNCANLNVLDVSQNRLKVIPKSLRKCTALQRLIAGSNRLKSLPDFLQNWRWLQVLDLSDNQIKKIHSGRLISPTLDRLDLSHNGLENLPSLDQLPEVQHLNLTGNRLSKTHSLPNRVKDLDLSRNRFNYWPETLNQLSRLRSLNLEYNAIAQLPESFGALCQSLENLQLKNNPVKCQPADLLPLANLATLTGLVPGRKFEQLFNFRSEAQWQNLPADWYRSFFQLFSGKGKELLPSFTPEQCMMALNFSGGQVHELTRIFLLKELGQSLRKKDFSELCVMGHSSFDLEILANRLQAQQIKFTTSLTTQTTHLLLGFPVRKKRVFTQTIPDQGIILTNERKLNQFLNKLEKGYLWKETSTEKLQSLQTLLLHNDRANVQLGIQMLHGGGVPEALREPLLVAFLKQYDTKLRHELLSLLGPDLKDKGKRIILEGYLDWNRLKSGELTKPEQTFLQRNGFSIERMMALRHQQT